MREAYRGGLHWQPPPIPPRPLAILCGRLIWDLKKAGEKRGEINKNVVKDHVFKRPQATKKFLLSSKKFFVQRKHFNKGVVCFQVDCGFLRHYESHPGFLRSKLAGLSIDQSFGLTFYQKPILHKKPQRQKDCVSRNPGKSNLRVYFDSQIIPGWSAHRAPAGLRGKNRKRTGSYKKSFVLTWKFECWE